MRRLLFVLVVANGWLLSVSAVALFILASTLNPMLLAFITGFAVENRTRETIRITPVGTVAFGSIRHPEKRSRPLD